MLRAHSLLWHYLWIAPNALLLALGFLLYGRRLHRQYPVFFAFTILGAIEQLTIYAADVTPAIDPKTWWYIFWIGLLVEGILKFGVIGEIFAHVFSAYASVANLSKLLIRGVGVVLVLAAAVAAAFAPQDSRFGIVSGAHLLEQTIYLTESGLLVFIFVFSAYFRLRLKRPVLGIALGLAVSACVHLATWAIAANGRLLDSRRVALDFVNMGTYHVCVLIWFYYLLVPQKVVTNTTVPPKASSGGPSSGSKDDLAVWNRELERLLHQ